MIFVVRQKNIQTRYFYTFRFFQKGMGNLRFFTIHPFSYRKYATIFWTNALIKKTGNGSVDKQNILSSSWFLMMNEQIKLQQIFLKDFDIRQYRFKPKKKSEKIGKFQIF